MAVHVQNHNSWKNDSQGEDDVSKFGYKKQLKRTLNLFSTFGLAFSYISPVVGVYTLFSTGICTSGPSYIWGLPVVVFGQMMVALVFSELSVVYPLAGALYQWARRLVGYRYGWFVGWIYGWALIVTIASIDLGAAPYIIGIKSEPWIVVLIAVLVSVIHSVINLSGVKVTAVITNMGLIVEIGMTVVLGGILKLNESDKQGIILFGPGPHQPISTLISRESYFYESGIAPPLMFLPALLSQAWIFFGFESAADVSEEIVDAKKSVPRAILLSLSGASLVTAFLEVALVLGIPQLSKITDPEVCSTNGAIPIIIEAHLGDTVSRILSLLLIVAYLSSAGAVQAAASRLLFSFARDDQVPFSETLKYVHPTTKVPTNSTIFLAVVPIIIILTNFIQLSDGISMELVVTNYAVIGIYSAFMLIVIGRLYAYFQKDFKSSDDSRYFSLRSFSIPIALTALVYQIAMITNLLWPRPANVVVGWLGIFITLAIFGSGIAITSLWVRNKARKSEETSPLIHY